MRYNKGMSMIGLLCAMAIIAILASVMFFGPSLGGGGDGDPTTPDSLPGQAVRAGEEAAEAQELRQIEMALEMARSDAGQWPASLDELNLPEDVLTSPVNERRYSYDPSTGEASRAAE